MLYSCYRVPHVRKLLYNMLGVYVSCVPPILASLSAPRKAERGGDREGTGRGGGVRVVIQGKVVALGWNVWVQEERRYEGGNMSRAPLVCV